MSGSDTKIIAVADTSTAATTISYNVKNKSATAWNAIAKTNAVRRSPSEHLKASFTKHPSAQGIYLLGSGAWGVKDIVAAENDLGVPVVHPVAARVWYVQKKLRVRNPIKGASRLLEELP